MQDKNLHVAGRAALLRRPSIQGRAAALPCLEGEDVRPAPAGRWFDGRNAAQKSNSDTASLGHAARLAGGFLPPGTARQRGKGAEAPRMTSQRSWHRFCCGEWLSCNETASWRH
jgi:hypothetical protein